MLVELCDCAPTILEVRHVDGIDPANLDFTPETEQFRYFDGTRMIGDHFFVTDEWDNGTAEELKARHPTAVDMFPQLKGETFALVTSSNWRIIVAICPGVSVVDRDTRRVICSNSAPPL